MIQGGGRHGNVHDVRQVLRCVGADMARNSARVTGAEGVVSVVQQSHEQQEIAKVMKTMVTEIAMAQYNTLCLHPGPHA